MFIQNQISHLTNHQDIITTEIDNADEMLFVVAYVRENGVDIILDKINGKPVKLLCSLDMGITQLSGIKKLIENGVDVKVYQSNKGTFHPKIWLFGKNKTNWRMLIGSANLTRAAFIDNVEASVLVDDENTTSNALMFFNYLWDRGNSSTITLDEINSLQEKVNERKAFKNKPMKVNQNDVDKNKIIFEYVKSWIDIPIFKSQGISKLWKGWYIVPDQRNINNTGIENFKSYLAFIKKPLHQSDDNYQKLLQEARQRNPLKRTQGKMSDHSLFVRQDKNYLLKLGWCYHPIKENGKLDKKILCLTDLGEKINQCESLLCVKNLYTNYFLNFSFNGLAIVPFTQKLLQRLEYLTLDEFDYFIVHAYNNTDLEIIIKLIEIYRSLENTAIFKEQFNQYFNEIKVPTANNVYGNYKKIINRTMEIIGWCNGFSLSDDFVLRLDNAN
ncbi:MAG: NgoFVII family restriction endonuclease [Methylococcales symbiont of Iophon sp. n. MRB-2018]|nr:MAG: NgoFVII family restriction endonuclease [Methylococcales symbiont of Iophon sp. n. MRB-2018]